MGDLADLLDRLNPDDYRRGKQFEHICKWFLTNDPLYKARLRHVWLWKEWPDRWSDTEAGIDLVAEDYDGHLWAIQAKAYREDRAIPKSELDKFLSESNRAQFSQRLLIATTDRLHHIAQTHHWCPREERVRRRTIRPPRSRRVPGVARLSRRPPSLTAAEA